ncbi:MlaD family protein [Actinomadura viridis]|uniref:MlaD family protein n=1 Tax=Actinomadura viridis TaxID=58110 RepID=UPI003694D419
MSDEPLSKRSRTLFGLVGAGVIAGSAALVAIGSTPSHEGSTYYTASFGRAGQGLDPGRSDVKIRGITVGTVEKVALERTGRVAVRVRVDPGVKVPRTAAARIEPVSVFGPKDLALDLGAGELTGPYLPDGGRIARTSDPQELAETAWPAYRLTRAINPDEVTTILRTLSSGLSGQGPALRRTIGNGTTVVEAMHANRAAIQSLINDISGLSGELGPRGGTINATVRDLNRLSPVISGRPDKVTRLLEESATLADTVGGTLQRRGADLGTIVDEAGRAVSVVAGQRHNVPVMIDSLNGFFAMLARIIRTDGPEGTKLASVIATLPLDLCKAIADVCETPFSGGASARQAGPRMVIQP